MYEDELLERLYEDRTEVSDSTWQSWAIHNDHAIIDCDFEDEGDEDE